MIRQQLVYLIGPITGCSYEECVNWREAVKTALEQGGRYHCLNPMRAEKHLFGSKKISQADDEKPGATGHDIVRRGHYDACRSEVAFVNLLGATRVSIGSVMEIAWAFDRGAHVVVCMEPTGNPHEDVFVRETASIRFPTLDQGVHYVKEVLNS